MSSGVHIHRSPDDGEGVSTYYGMGANWMFALKRITPSQEEEEGDMDICSYARNGELRFVCADVYAVDCDSAC